jgi:hypothetical protein
MPLLLLLLLRREKKKKKKKKKKEINRFARRLVSQNAPPNQSTAQPHGAHDVTLAIHYHRHSRRIPIAHARAETHESHQTAARDTNI